MQENQGQQQRRSDEEVRGRAREAARAFSGWVNDKVDWLLSPPFLPDDTRTHMSAARREMLLAVRSLIDHSLERSEEAERRRAARRPTKIDVQ